ncbi:RNA ligase/cyclic nucleotide phosphodiesterase [Podospora aff. communis PSN243]|uniref:RNA ligase/cyclic nucleotide phosphodiesterase n=1 Tax=Podospora aff. communis PSN243 TaxID=3040156 RepID=A0AAV9GIN9_9PEZI|nr:RNA ligase/cyclic nucleotide phosphodiesterase [Podospora aff. communis PSN243]
MGSQLEAAELRNKLEDLSGVEIKPGQNPYEALINVCNGRPAEIQALYATHRTARNAQQKEKFLASDFKELIIDQVLLRLEDKSIEPGFQDLRNCFVFWARPPDHVVRLAVHLQDLLKEAAPGMWLMPPHRMHLTTLEIAHSRTPEEIADMVSKVRPSMSKLTHITYTRRSRLVKPFISYDLSAVAVSFLPAAGEKVVSPAPALPHDKSIAHPGWNDEGTEKADAYTYHHLRRDVFELAKDTGVEIGSRYVVPSAHITLGRYLNHADHKTPEQRQRWVQKIDEINHWLEKEVWDVGDGEFVGEWIVGQERGLDARCGTLWYGGGKTIVSGEGF